MTRHLIILTASLILTVATVFGQTLTCTILSDKTVYNKGQAPNITVEIKNNTDSTIQLVKTLDGSNGQRRFPYAYFQIEKIGDTTYRTRKYGTCGNMDGIDSADFMEVKPNETFSPYAFQTPIYSDYSIKDTSNFSKRGKYKITFHYSTNEPDFKKWLGDDFNAIYYFFERTKNRQLVLRADKKAEYEKLLKLFAKVPKTSTASNDLIIEIK